MEKQVISGSLNEINFRLSACFSKYNIIHFPYCKKHLQCIDEKCKQHF